MLVKVRAFRSLVRNDRGAIGPMYVVALTALVAIAGVGFDYGRLMAMQSELQNAADQSALAAATQLNGQDGAIVNARAAARNYFVNETHAANDEEGRAVTIADGGFTFYSDGEAGTVTTLDIDASAVEVVVNSREVFYALTPIVDAVSSGGITARARAKLVKASCNGPALMFCVPEDANGVAERDFPQSHDIGKQLMLHMRGNAAEPWAPGNFNFLTLEKYAATAKAITGNENTTLGLAHPLPECVAMPIMSRTGSRTPEVQSFDTRFDFYKGVMKESLCDPSLGHYCPAVNVRQQGERVYIETTTIKLNEGQPAPPAPACGSFTSRSETTLPPAQAYPLGYPDDACILTGTCTVLGDGDWNHAAYFANRTARNPTYLVPSAGDLGRASMEDVLRYDVYRWELDHLATNQKVELVSAVADPPETKGGKTTYTFRNTCAYPYPLANPPGFPASSTVKDRRVLTVAAVDCTNLHGDGEVDILRWVDMFILQSPNSAAAFSVEIIGPAARPDETNSFQYYARNRAVLIR